MDVDNVIRPKYSLLYEKFRGGKRVTRNKDGTIVVAAAFMPLAQEQYPAYR